MDRYVPPTHLDDEMTAISNLEIRWRLVDDHVAAVRIIADHETVELGATYVRDSFSRLIQAAEDIKIGCSATYVFLAGEPAGSILFLSREVDEVQIEAVSFSAISAAFTRFSSGALRWRGVVVRQRFIEAVWEMGESVRAEYGELGFERSWGYPFPTEKLAALRY